MSSRCATKGFRVSNPRSDSAPKAIGVTGGIGCGKSEVARCLRSDGVPVLDADDVARDVVAPGSEALAEIVGLFGAGVLQAEGQLNRGALANVVFSDAVALQTLNAIVHPRVRQTMQAWVAEHRSAGRSCAGVIPLLFETGGEATWDAVICIAASEQTSSARLKTRGWNEEEISRRRAAQWPLEAKMKRADLVIENNGTLEELATQVRAAWKKLLE